MVDHRGWRQKNGWRVCREWLQRGRGKGMDTGGGCRMDTSQQMQGMDARDDALG